MNTYLVRWTEGVGRDRRLHSEVVTGSEAAERLVAEKEAAGHSAYAVLDKKGEVAAWR